MYERDANIGKEGIGREGGSQKSVGRKWGEEKVVKGIGERKGTEEKRKRKKGKGN